MPLSPNDTWIGGGVSMSTERIAARTRQTSLKRCKNLARFSVLMPSMNDHFRLAQS